MEKDLNNKTFNVISRSSKKKAMKAFEFKSWDTLKEQLGINEFSVESIFSDLSLGAWRGHWIIREFSSQLNLPVFSEIQPLIGFERENEEYTETINHLIDTEGEGDQNFIMAYEECKTIIKALKKQNIKWVIIIPPLKGISWESENLKFINLLIDGLQDSDCKVALLCTKESNIPNEWEVEFDYKNEKKLKSDNFFPIPGVLDINLTQLLNDFIPNSSLKLSNNHTIISPNMRRVGDINIDISKKLENYTWLKAYCEIVTLNSSENIIYFLQVEAAKRFSEGGYGIALKILKHIREISTSKLQTASIILQIQNIRIALMLFQDAATEAFSLEGLAEEYTYSLYLSKAWGLVMTDSPQEAEPYFKYVQEYFLKYSMNDKKEYLYLLNIYALNKLKLGDLNEAFGFEKEIENILSKQQRKDWHIFYINAINQARLYKKTKEYTLSEEYYLKAFDVNQYLKSESDLLYTNLCFAQLEELRENYKSSFIFWLRACIHWLSNETPEALAPRVAQAILHKKLSNEAGQVEEISEKLKNNLLEIFMKVFGHSITPINRSNIVFTRIEHSLHNPEIAIGTMGLGLFVSNKDEPIIYDGLEYSTLTKYVYTIMSILLPELSNYNSIYTDTQFGSEIPVSSKELLISCIRHQVSKVIFGTHKYTLTEKEQQNLFLNAKVSVCSAISEIVKNDKNMLIVYYKRNKKPLFLSELQKSILDYLSESMSVETLLNKFNNKNLLNTLKEMEENRLITICL